ncbi:hypothetical protein D3C71_897550 [compost metagenome]
MGQPSVMGAALCLKGNTIMENGQKQDSTASLNQAFDQLANDGPLSIVSLVELALDKKLTQSQADLLNTMYVRAVDLNLLRKTSRSTISSLLFPRQGSIHGTPPSNVYSARKAVWNACVSRATD